MTLWTPPRRGWLGRPTFVALAVATALAVPIGAQSPAERVDLDAVYKIKDEGFQRSQVMELTSYLTDVYGPRLTGSPNLKAAADYTVGKLTEWGATNVKLEPWGPFGRGWTNEGFSFQAVAPQVFPIIGYPKAWTPGTNGPVTGDAVIVVIEKEEDFAKYKGQLKGKFVLASALQDVPAHFEPDGKRYTEEQLDELSAQPDPSQRTQRFPPGGPGGQMGLNRQRMKFFADEGVAAVLETSRKGDGGTFFIGSGGSREPKDPPTAPQLIVTVEHYGRLYRMIEKKQAVKLQLDAKNVFHDKDLNAFNIVGEIPGTDKADEVVMLGAHFDSWHAGTGATDNAAGSAVMLEAMRILKATGLKMRRTVRIGLWTGEEQGLLGSRAYVKDHFADRTTMAVKPEHAKFSSYFNVDNGTGAIRGVYLQGNEAVAPIFSAWMAPFHNLGMTHLTIRNTGGTDHQAFDGVGLPGFQFIQDPVEYDSRTHHSNMDVYERIQARDMMQNAVIVASFVYHAANRDTILPRKPLPKPQPDRTGPPATTATSASSGR